MDFYDVVGGLVLVFVLVFMTVGVYEVMFGVDYQAKCVAKYGDMPANKVQEYCKELLMFKQESLK